MTIDVDRLATEMVNGCQLLMAPLKARLDAAEARIAELGAEQVKFAGIWQASTKYQRGNLVTHQGGLWFCCGAAEGTRPGDASGLWQLAVKKGGAE